MTTLLCVSDIHDDERKHRQMVDYARGCDAVITCGDDCDKEFEEQQSESDLILAKLCKKYQPNISEVTKQKLSELLTASKRRSEEQQKEAWAAFIKEHPDFVAEDQRMSTIRKDFLAYFTNRAKAINAFYQKTGLPVYGTPGNHDPLPALKEMTAINYLMGTMATFKELHVAGLPATGEWVSKPLAELCGDYYAHLMQYSPNEHSDLAKKLLDKPIEVFITHKAYLPELQEWDKYYREGQPLHEFGVDAGAAAVDKKQQPVLNVFGHYHMDRPKVKRSENGKQWFLYVGPNAAVRVTFDGKTPVEFKSNYYA